MDEQQLANQPVDPVAQAEEIPTTNLTGADPSQEVSQPEVPAEPSPSIEDSAPVEASPVEEPAPSAEEAPSTPVNQSEVFKTEYEALVAKTGFCLSVSPKPFKDDSGVYDLSKFTLEVTVAENK